MSEVTYRAMTLDDAAAVNALMAAAEAVDRTQEHYDVEDVREDASDPALDLTHDWVLAEVDGVVVAHQRLVPRAPADGAQSIGVDGAVHPVHRGRGLGTDLVARMVRRARAKVIEHGLRPIVTATVPSDLADAVAVLEAAGLRGHRWTFVMSADLAGGPRPEPPPLPGDLTLHTWDGSDHDELRGVHNLAFADLPGFTPWDAPMWAQWVSGSRAFRPTSSLLLRAGDGRVASYVQCSEYEANQAATGRRELWVGKVGTVPEHRRRGLAGLLLQHVLQRAQAAGYDEAGLDVDSENPTGANAVYERVGFGVTRRWTNLRAAD